MSLISYDCKPFGLIKFHLTFTKNRLVILSIIKHDSLSLFLVKSM